MIVHFSPCCSTWLQPVPYHVTCQSSEPWISLSGSNPELYRRAGSWCDRVSLCDVVAAPVQTEPPHPIIFQSCRLSNFLLGSSPYTLVRIWLPKVDNSPHPRGELWYNDTKVFSSCIKSHFFLNQPLHLLPSTRLWLEARSKQTGPN